MLKNYLKITIRNMVRHKLFTIINVLGLSISIACSLLLFVYVSDQLSYDTHHGENVFRLKSYLAQSNGNELDVASSSMPLAPAIKDGVEGVKNAARILNTTVFGGKDVITFGEESFTVEDGSIADSSLFSILKYDIIAGNQLSPFSNTKSIVLEKSLAQKLFGNDRALGKVVKLSTRMGINEYEVSAVYDESTYPTHYSPGFIINMQNENWKSLLEYFGNQWVGNNLAYTYIKLDDSKNKDYVMESITDLFLQNAQEEMKATGIKKEMSLQPVSEIHTDTQSQFSAEVAVDPKFVYVLSGISVFIILLACVNYINLSTAQSGNRAMEVGLKKVMGITSKGLVSQFLGESFFMVLISICLSILIAELSLPLFNSFVDHPIVLDGSNLFEVVLYLLGFLIITAFVAGLYPAVYLSSFKPATVLKGKNRDKGSAVLLRKVLVTFQFVISIVLISSILVISNQVDFLFNKDLGFQTGSKIILPLNSNDASENYALLKKQFASLGGVSSVAATNFIPGTRITNDILIFKDGQTMDDAVYILNNSVDEDYLKTLNIDLLAGRNFTVSDYQDTVYRRVIINKAATEQLRLSVNEAVGEVLHFDWQGQSFTFQVVGVSQDINQNSLHQEIQPMMFAVNNGGFQYLVAETTAQNFEVVKDQMGQKWAEVLPNDPFEPFPLDIHIQNQYESDIKTFNLIQFFAFISIFISCMGLYALSMFVAERKFKEIGVRKALGANVKDILILVSRELSILVVVSFFIAIPIAYYSILQWLDSFAYKITPSISTFILSGIISVGIAWLTISYQSIRASQTNPTDTLRAE